jgi:hypothetical protein
MRVQSDLTEAHDGVELAVYTDWPRLFSRLWASQASGGGRSEIRRCEAWSRSVPSRLWRGAFRLGDAVSDDDLVDLEGRVGTPLHHAAAELHLLVRIVEVPDGQRYPGIAARVAPPSVTPCMSQAPSPYDGADRVGRREPADPEVIADRV